MDVSLGSVFQETAVVDFLEAAEVTAPLDTDPSRTWRTIDPGDFTKLENDIFVFRDVVHASAAVLRRVWLEILG